MFSRIRRRFTFANVALTLALVFAMTGGAYAAKKYLVTSTKQISPSVLKALVGKAGAAGAQGPAGPAGSQGPVGTAGAKGETGAAGKDGVQGQAGKEGPTGPKGATGAAGAKGATGPVGATGAEGVCSTSSCHLPANVTETGVYGVSGVSSIEPTISSSMDEGTAGPVEVSFNIPVVPAPSFVYVAGPSAPTAKKNGFGAESKGTGILTTGEKKITGVVMSSGEFTAGSAISGTGINAKSRIAKVISPTELELTEAAIASGSGVQLTMGEGCAGVTGGVPKAGSGKFCIYGYGLGEGFSIPPAVASVVEIANSDGGFGLPNPAGALLKLECAGAEFGFCYGKGLWAVTG
jgi:hypothetical protein